MPLVYKGPDLKLYKKSVFNLKQDFNITGMRISAQNGSVLSIQEADLHTTAPMVEYEEPNMLYGATVELEYTLQVTNNSDEIMYTSPNTDEKDKEYDEEKIKEEEKAKEEARKFNGCEEATFYVFLPPGFSYNNKKQSLITTDNEMRSDVRTEIKPKQITAEDIVNNEELKEMYLDELEDTDLYNEIVNNSCSAVRIKVKFDEKELLKVEQSFTIKFIVSKLINGIEEDPYEGRVEIFQYKNHNSRRMETYIDKNNKIAKGSTAGDGEIQDLDSKTSSNVAVVIPPTGKDKRMIGTYILILTLTVLTIIILQQRKKK